MDLRGDQPYGSVLAKLTGVSYVGISWMRATDRLGDENSNAREGGTGQGSEVRGSPALVNRHKWPRLLFRICFAAFATENKAGRTAFVRCCTLKGKIERFRGRYFQAKNKVVRGVHISIMNPGPIYICGPTSRDILTFFPLQAERRTSPWVPLSLIDKMAMRSEFTKTPFLLTLSTAKHALSKEARLTNADQTRHRSIGESKMTRVDFDTPNKPVAVEDQQARCFPTVTFRLPFSAHLAAPPRPHWWCPNDTNGRRNPRSSCRLKV